MIDIVLEAIREVSGMSASPDDVIVGNLVDSLGVAELLATLEDATGHELLGNPDALANLVTAASFAAYLEDMGA